MDKGAAVVSRQLGLQVFEQPSGGGVFTGNVLSSALTDVADSEEVTSFTVYDSVVELPPWPTAKTQEDSFDQPTPCDAAPSGRPVSFLQLSSEGWYVNPEPTQASLGCLLPMAFSGKVTSDSPESPVITNGKSINGPTPPAEPKDPNDIRPGGAMLSKEAMDSVVKGLNADVPGPTDAEAERILVESTRNALLAIQATMGPGSQIHAIANAGRLAVVLRGDIKLLLQTGDINKLQAQVDELTGCPGTYYEIRSISRARIYHNAALEEKWLEGERERLTVAPQHGPGGGGRRRSVEPPLPLPEPMEHDPIILLISLPLPTVTVPHPPNKTDKPAASALANKPRRSKRNITLVPLPAGQKQVKMDDMMIRNMMEKWEAMSIMVAKAIKNKPGLRIAGLRPMDVMAYHEVSVQCTVPQLIALITKMKDGQLWGEKVVAVHHKMLLMDEKVRPGVMAATGENLLSSMRATMRLQSDQQLKHECRLPQRILKAAPLPTVPILDPWKLNLSNLGVLDSIIAAEQDLEDAWSKAPPVQDDSIIKKAFTGSSLQASIQRLQPGDVLEVQAGTWTGPVILESPGVTVRGVGEVVFASTTDHPAVIVRSSCRLQGVKMTCRSQHHAALVIEKGHPEVLDCIINGQHGCVRALPSTGMLMQRCKVQGTISLAAAVVIEQAHGAIVDCEVSWTLCLAPEQLPSTVRP
jgi:hypothetical protein